MISYVIYISKFSYKRYTSKVSYKIYAPKFKDKSSLIDKTVKNTNNEKLFFTLCTLYLD